MLQVYSHKICESNSRHLELAIYFSHLDIVFCWFKTRKVDKSTFELRLVENTLAIRVFAECEVDAWHFNLIMDVDEIAGEEMAEEDLMANAKVTYEVFIQNNLESTSHTLEWLRYKN